MDTRKFAVRICAWSLIAIATASCERNAGQTAATGAPPEAEVSTSPSGFPQWAFPKPLLLNAPGSDVKLAVVRTYDRTAAVDWFPSSHPAMPDVVKGRPSVFACGFCHLPQGSGRSENAAIAGLSRDYILQQLADFKSGARKTADPTAGAQMEKTARDTRDADAEAAAKYFSSLTYTKHLKIVETVDVPHFTSKSVYVFDSGPRQKLGQRIIEGPDDFDRFEMRDPNATFTAYVPVGALARGAALAKGDDERPACEACHGAGLKGDPAVPVAPPIAGRLPTGMFRQLYAMQTGARHGVNAAQMKPIVDTLSQADMIDLSAYVASLDP